MPDKIAQRNRNKSLHKFFRCLTHNLIQFCRNFSLEEFALHNASATYWVTINLSPEFYFWKFSLNLAFSRWKDSMNSITWAFQSKKISTELYCVALYWIKYFHIIKSNKVHLNLYGKSFYWISLNAWFILCCIFIRKIQYAFEYKRVLLLKMLYHLN